MRRRKRINSNNNASNEARGRSAYKGRRILLAVVANANGAGYTVDNNHTSSLTSCSTIVDNLQGIFAIWLRVPVSTTEAVAECVT